MYQYANFWLSVQVIKETTCGKINEFILHFLYQLWSHIWYWQLLILVTGNFLKKKCFSVSITICPIIRLCQKITSVEKKWINLNHIVLIITFVHYIFPSNIYRQKNGDEQGSLNCEGLVHPLRQYDCSNGSSPNPAGLGLNEHVIKMDSLNVAENGGWLRSHW